MSKQPINYAVVGLGRAGWGIHVNNLRGRDDAKIVAVVDGLEERRNEAAKEFGCKTYDNITDMLKQADVEVVTVATPSVAHGPNSIEALQAGKHVVVEKPMAMSVVEADQMIEAANKAGRKLFVHQNYRFFREFTYYEDVIASGILGKVFHMRNYINAFRRRNDWQTLNKNGGGVLNNTCPHMIDQIIQLAGANIETVLGDLQQIASAGDVEDHVKAFIKFENGVTADMEVSQCEKTAVSLPKWIICGSCGTLTSDGKHATIHFFDPAKAPRIEAVDGPVMSRSYGNNDELPWQEKVEEAIGTDRGNFYDNVYAVLRENAEMRITPESVREVIRCIDMIRVGTKFPGQMAALSGSAG